MRLSGCLFALLILVLGSCEADEVSFSGAVDRTAGTADAEKKTDNTNNKGSYSGDVVVYKVPPSQADPGNKYVKYDETGMRTWTVNRLVAGTKDDDVQRG